MSDTVNIKWVDGTLRSVDKDAFIVTRGVGIHKAGYIAQEHSGKHWDGEAILAKVPEPPVVKSGVDPHSFKGWTLCEIDTATGILYREIKEGRYRVRYSTGFSTGSSIPESWTILRAIHVPSEGMNLIYTDKDGKVIEMHTDDLEFESDTTDFEIEPSTYYPLTSFSIPRVKCQFSGTLSPNSEGYFMKVIDNGKT